ncbi:hypothetical protein JCM14076_26610 [Methylosoma difficile]
MSTHKPSTPPQTPQAVQACHELLLWMIPQLDKFPRARRFTLGSQIETGLLSVLGHLVEAAYSKQKHAALRLANRQLEVNRHLWRLAHELQIISTKSYEHGSQLMNNMGRQIGGWLNACLND